MTIYNQASNIDKITITIDKTNKLLCYLFYNKLINVFSIQ